MWFVSLFSVLASLTFSVCQQDDPFLTPSLSSEWGLGLAGTEQNFLSYQGNASSQDLRFLTPVGAALVRRDCTAGNKACNGGCIPTDGTCCANGKYCGVSSPLCCSGSCGPAGGHCCEYGQGCASTQDCCEQSCIPAGSSCCKGGYYCNQGNQCVVFNGQGKCCIDLQCNSFVGDNGVTTTRPQAYTFTYTVYWYSYYYTVLDLTSTRSTFRTTFYITALGSADASATAAITTSSIRRSLTANANTTPRTTPTARATATAGTARSTAYAAEPTNDDGGLDSGDFTVGPSGSATRTNAPRSSYTLFSGGDNSPVVPSPGAASRAQEVSKHSVLAMLALCMGIFWL